MTYKSGIHTLWYGFNEMSIAFHKLFIFRVQLSTFDINWYVQCILTLIIIHVMFYSTHYLWTCAYVFLRLWLCGFRFQENKLFASIKRTIYLHHDKHCSKRQNIYIMDGELIKRQALDNSLTFSKNFPV